MDKIGHKTQFKIEKFKVGEKTPYKVEEWEGNTGLNEGLNLLTSLLCGGAGTAYDNANAYIGVGDSNTAPAAAQTGLQAASNKFWQGMEVSFPTSGTSQQAVWKASIADGDAEYAWEEFTITNASDDTGVNLLRTTASKGTKASGEVWDVTITVTFS